MQCRCPVCSASFRAALLCSRCGADLGPLMRLAAHAARLRRSALVALAEGEFRKAAESSARAQRMHSTPRGRNLAQLTVWLAGEGSNSPR